MKKAISCLVALAMFLLPCVSFASDYSFENDVLKSLLETCFEPDDHPEYSIYNSDEGKFIILVDDIEYSTYAMCYPCYIKTCMEKIWVPFAKVGYDYYKEATGNGPSICVVVLDPANGTGDYCAAVLMHESITGEMDVYYPDDANNRIELSAINNTDIKNGASVTTLNAILDALWEKGFPRYYVSYMGASAKSYYIAITYTKPLNFSGTPEELKEMAESMYREKLEKVKAVMNRNEKISVVINDEERNEICTFEISK